MIISGSEAGDYDTCRRKHYYRFEEELTPKQGPTGMDRGTQVHLGLQAYFSHLKEHGNSPQAFEEARALAIHVVHMNSLKDPSRTEMYNLAMKMLRNYFRFYGDEKLEILVVEGEYLYEISPNLTMGFRVDLVARFLEGPFAGRIFLWDHKTAYKFWKDIEVRLNPQFPKYVRGLRKALGLEVSGVVVNQLRSRDDIVDINKMFKRAYHEYSELVIQTRMEEFEETADEIKFNRLHTKGKKPRRTQNGYTCHDCFYAEVCRMEVEGKDASDVKEMYFKKTSSYSYGEKY